MSSFFCPSREFYIHCQTTSKQNKEPQSLDDSYCPFEALLRSDSNFTASTKYSSVKPAQQKKVYDTITERAVSHIKSRKKQQLLPLCCCQLSPLNSFLMCVAECVYLCICVRVCAVSPFNW